jgi:threonine/homoserine/homoserine lactone efflux protein
MGQMLFLFWSAFVVALSGAMMPGPVLTATISEVMKRGFIAGPLIIVGHAILEISLLVAVVAGLGAWITRDLTMALLGVGGGVLLVAMGTQMALTAGKAADEAMRATADARAAVRGPVLTGILTSLANPYWTLWWATIGLNYAALALRSGIPGLASFYSGHILADLVWYSLIAAAVTTGRRICPRSVYVGLLVLCGLVLVGLGAYFLAAGAARLV